MDQAAKQQLVDRIKQAENILVTVSTNPSVDQLAACIGATLMFNKLQKHATAVFSGVVPSTIEFLQPEKTLEKNTDSLRDFIISLDKNKADKLRYKVEDQVVRIYITPYRTSLSEKDVQFSQGDFNVELVLALGVKDKTQLDSAITAHGRILHDAAVVCVNAGQTKVPELGQINWQDPTASSLSEMLVSISEALGSGLIDNQIATAFLTGIVAETERFSNTKTSPKVMTMSAQLMAAGANQQLIATKLNTPPPSTPPATAVRKQPPNKPKTGTGGAGVLNVDHGAAKKPELEQEVRIDPMEIRIDEKGNIERAADVYRKNHPQPQGENNLSANLARPFSSESSAPATSSAPIISKHDAQDEMLSQGPPPFSAGGSNSSEWYDPMTADQPAATKDPLNLEDGMVSKAPSLQPITSAMKFDNSAASTLPAAPSSTGASTPPADLDNARNAVQSALAAAPYDPASEGPISALNAQPMVDLHQQAASSSPVSASTPQPVDMAPPAPPPVPPPLPFSNAAPSSSAASNQNNK